MEESEINQSENHENGQNTEIENQDTNVQFVEVQLSFFKTLKFSRDYYSIHTTAKFEEPFLYSMSIIRLNL